MMKKSLFYLINLVLVGVFVLNISIVFGGGPGGTAGSNTTLTNPIGINDPNLFIGKLINSALGVVGSIALVMFIYGGFRWLTSAGSKDGVTAGKETIIWATFGLVIIFTSYAIVNFILKDVLLPGSN